MLTPNGSIDEVIVVYNHAKNSAEQQLREELLLPVDTVGSFEAAKAETADESAGEKL